jgi:hypothetical protein
LLEAPREAIWSTLKVPSLKLAYLSAGAARIAGFKNRELHTAYGSFSSDGFIIEHSISTDHSWSGSPLVVGKGVVGIHTGAWPSRDVNEGTSPFWIHTGKSLETPHDVKNLAYVEDLPQGDYVDFEFSTSKYTHTVRRVGKFAKVINSEKLDADIHWSLEDDIAEFFTESAINNEKSATVFPKPATASPVKSMKTSSLPGNIKQKKILKVVLASNTKEESKDKVALANKPKPPKFSSQQQRKGKVLHSGVSPKKVPQPSSSLSPSKPKDIVVKMVLMSRKQEKLYNGIIHTRKFQQCLRNGTDAENSQLRRSLLAYVTSPTPSTGNPVQDFLGIHCRPRMETSSTLISSLSSMPL